ncbi:hypothetical protein HYH03_010896 [Edaphochlamys debaryana]|uniref:Endonuclease/exonuclease/phosphatase domain-containing protein n=1 Tax=Edaphochlamys debaryana TaxID=47281 RepID=A0A835XV77_9CHLO|nr:hypothetical protein HYH03_010896 [Edaphochlamys debaryana]|eukprot:KAG2490741.1 hypothetical protein HYH03_010896 [Edaphochlamys debaryana]
MDEVPSTLRIQAVGQRRGVDSWEWRGFKATYTSSGGADSRSHGVAKGFVTALRVDPANAAAVDPADPQLWGGMRSALQAAAEVARGAPAAVVARRIEAAGPQAQLTPPLKAVTACLSRSGLGRVTFGGTPPPAPICVDVPVLWWAPFVTTEQELEQVALVEAPAMKLPLSELQSAKALLGPGWWVLPLLEPGLAEAAGLPSHKAVRYAAFIWEEDKLLSYFGAASEGCGSGGAKTLLASPAAASEAAREDGGGEEEEEEEEESMPAEPAAAPEAASEGSGGGGGARAEAVPASPAAAATGAGEAAGGGRGGARAGAVQSSPAAAATGAGEPAGGGEGGARAEAVPASPAAATGAGEAAGGGEGGARAEAVPASPAAAATGAGEAAGGGGGGARAEAVPASPAAAATGAGEPAGVGEGGARPGAVPASPAAAATGAGEEAGGGRGGARAGAVPASPAAAATGAGEPAGVGVGGARAGAVPASPAAAATGAGEVAGEGGSGARAGAVPASPAAATGPVSEGGGSVTEEEAESAHTAAAAAGAAERSGFGAGGREGPETAPTTAPPSAAAAKGGSEDEELSNPDTSAGASAPTVVPPKQLRVQAFRPPAIRSKTAKLWKPDGACGLQMAVVHPAGAAAADGAAPSVRTFSAGFVTALPVDPASAINPVDPQRWFGMQSALAAAAAQVAGDEAAGAPGTPGAAAAQAATTDEAVRGSAGGPGGEGQAAPGPDFPAAAGSAPTASAGCATAGEVGGVQAGAVVGTLQAVTTARLVRTGLGAGKIIISITLDAVDAGPDDVEVKLDRPLPSWLSFIRCVPREHRRRLMPGVATEVSFSVRVEDAKLMGPGPRRMEPPLPPLPYSAVLSIRLNRVPRKLPLLWWAPLLTLIESPKVPPPLSKPHVDLPLTELRCAEDLLGRGWVALPLDRKLMLATGLPRKLRSGPTYVAFARAEGLVPLPAEVPASAGLGEAELYEGEDEELEHAPPDEDEVEEGVASLPHLPSLRLVTFNIQGLTRLDLVERALFGWQRGLAPLPDVICIQEAKCEDESCTAQQAKLTELTTRMAEHGYKYVHAGELMILWRTHSMYRPPTYGDRPDLVWRLSGPDYPGGVLQAAWGALPGFDAELAALKDAVTGARVDGKDPNDDSATFFRYPPITVVLQHKVTRTFYVITTVHTPGSGTTYTNAQLRREVAWLMRLERYRAVMAQLVRKDGRLRALARARGGPTLMPQTALPKDAPRVAHIVAAPLVNTRAHVTDKAVAAALNKGDTAGAAVAVIRGLSAEWHSLQGRPGFEPSTLTSYADVVYVLRDCCFDSSSSNKSPSGDARLHATTFSIVPSDLLEPGTTSVKLTNGSDHKPLLVELREAGLEPVRCARQAPDVPGTLAAAQALLVEALATVGRGAEAAATQVERAAERVVALLEWLRKQLPPAFKSEAEDEAGPAEVEAAAAEVEAGPTAAVEVQAAEASAGPAVPEVAAAQSAAAAEAEAGPTAAAETQASEAWAGPAAMEAAAAKAAAELVEEGPVTLVVEAVAQAVLAVAMTPQSKLAAEPAAGDDASTPPRLAVEQVAAPATPAQRQLHL